MKRYINTVLLGLVWITAYHSHHLTALETHPRPGICAVSRSTGIKLGSRIKIGKKIYRAEDYCRRGVDIWLSNKKQCKRFGRKKMLVKVIRSHAAKHGLSHSPLRGKHHRKT